MAIALFINDTLVFASPSDRGPSTFEGRPIIAETLERNYDGPATLAFRIDGGFQSPGYSPDDRVKLQIDGATVFVGRLGMPRVLASVNTPWVVQYNSHDDSHIQRPATSSNGVTSIALPAGRLGDAVDEYLSHISDHLAEVGLATSVNYAGGAENVQVLPVSLTDKTVTEGFRILAQSAPGVRAHVTIGSDGKPIWQFVSIYASDITTIEIDQTIVDQLDIQHSLEGRAGAVRTTQRTVSGATSSQSVIAMSPAWDTNLESQWVLNDARSADAAGAEDPLSLIYRLWSFASFAGQVTREAEVAVHVVLPGMLPPRQVQVAIDSINWNNKLVLLTYPAIKPQKKGKASHIFNPTVPGRARAAATKLRFTTGGSGSITVPGSRYPGSGFAGTAYDLAPVSMAFERQVDLPDGVDPELYAYHAWRALSEPLIQGSLPIAGDPPKDLLLLDRRVNLATSSHGEIGFESIDAPVNGIRWSFEHGGRVDLDFSTDLTGLLRGGLG